MTYKPAPFALDQAPPDLAIGQAMFYLGLSARSVQRLCETGAVESYRLGGDARRIVFASVRAYRQACLDRGPQFARRPVTAKRPRGRPRKPRPESPPQTPE